MFSTTPQSFIDGFRLIDGTELNDKLGNPQWSTTTSVTATPGGNVNTSIKVVDAITNITSAVANAGITIPQALPGKVLVVSNSTANPVIVYAAGGSTIGGVPGNVGISLTAYQTLYIFAVDTQQWMFSFSLPTQLSANTVTPALRALQPVAQQVVNVSGYYAIGDGGGGEFYAATGAAPGTYVDNGGTIIVPTGGNGSSAWLRIYAGTINAKWFGLKGDDVNDTARMQALFAASAGSAIFFPNGTYNINVDISVPTKTRIYGAGQGRTIIKQIQPVGTTGFVLNNVTEVVISDMSFTTNATTIVSSGALVGLFNSTHCTIERCEFYNHNFGAIYLGLNANYNTIQNNWIHDAVPSTGAQADIHVGYGSYNEGNKILNNYIDGKDIDVGVQILNSSGQTPVNTTVSGNYIGQHNGYGIADYGNGVTRTLMSNNYIENIQGTTSGNSKGAGIYTVGTAGQTITNNTIVNCCVQTTNSTLIPAAIGCGAFNSVGGVGPEPTIISGNRIQNMTRFYGIYVFDRENFVVSNNTIEMPSTNYITSAAINMVNCSNSIVSGNSVKLTSNLTDTSGGVVIRAINPINNLQVIGNNISGGNAFGLRVTSDNVPATGANISVVGNSAIMGTANATPYTFILINNLTISNNIFSGNGASCGAVDRCLNARFTNNNFLGTTTNFITASGNCAGSFMDKTNYWDQSVASPTLTLSTFKIEFFAAAPPLTGNWTVGSSIVNSSPAVGSPVGWVCSVAGPPGTWTALANL